MASVNLSPRSVRFASEVATEMVEEVGASSDRYGAASAYASDSASFSAAAQKYASTRSYSADPYADAEGYSGTSALGSGAVPRANGYAALPGTSAGPYSALPGSSALNSGSLPRANGFASGSLPRGSNGLSYQQPSTSNGASPRHSAASGYRKPNMDRLKELPLVYKDHRQEPDFDPETFMAFHSRMKDTLGIPIDRSLITFTIDFSHPDGWRTRPLLVEGRQLFVCDEYVSMWSPVLRAYVSEAPQGTEIRLAKAKYRHFREALECLSPMHKEVDERNATAVLPVAFEYQMEGLLARCESYLLNCRLSFLERLWMADAYKLERLLCRCLAELLPTEKPDLSGPRYHGLSDRVKVLLLERLHGAAAPMEGPEPVSAIDRFARRTELNSAAISGTGKRTLYANATYLAAWSSTIADRITSQGVCDDFATGCSTEELKAFLFAVHPPQMRLTEENVGPVLVGACKLESEGLIRRCARFLLDGACELSVFARFSLIDRCFLHELLEPCLKGLNSPEQALDMTLQPSYDCLSTKARAAILDRLGILLSQPGLRPHHCHRYVQENSPEQALDMTLQPSYDCLSTKARAAILDRLGILLSQPGLRPHHCHRYVQENSPEQALDMTLQPSYDCLSTKARAAILDRLGILLSQPGLRPHHCHRYVQENSPEQALDMTLQPSYDCLSTKARAAILERLGILLSQPGLRPHHCHRCSANSNCLSVGWNCPRCGEFQPPEEK